MLAVLWLLCLCKHVSATTGILKTTSIPLSVINPAGGGTPPLLVQIFYGVAWLTLGRATLQLCWLQMKYSVMIPKRCSRAAFKSQLRVLVAWSLNYLPTASIQRLSTTARARSTARRALEACMLSSQLPTRWSNLCALLWPHLGTSYICANSAKDVNITELFLSQTVDVIHPLSGLCLKVRSSCEGTLTLGEPSLEVSSIRGDILWLCAIIATHAWQRHPVISWSTPLWCTRLSPLTLAKTKGTTIISLAVYGQPSSILSIISRSWIYQVRATGASVICYRVWPNCWHALRSKSGVRTRSGGYSRDLGRW